MSPEDHKTGSATGLSREFLLPEVLTATLDEWLNVWRGRVITNHQLVFISLGSQEALAALMGHSLREADEIYNYMTPIEKTKKALNWWQPSPN